MPARPELPGRTKEVARLRDAWAAAVVGEPRLLLLTGEAGIGKTRLATEVVALAETTGGLVMQARCYTAERSLFLQPFVDALAGPVATMRADRLRELPGLGPPRSLDCYRELTTFSIHRPRTHEP